MSEVLRFFRKALLDVNEELSRMPGGGMTSMGRIDYDTLDAVDSSRPFCLIYEDVFYMYEGAADAESALHLLWQRLHFMEESFRQRGVRIQRGGFQRARRLVREVLGATSEQYGDVFPRGG